LGPAGRLLAFDKDIDAVDCAGALALRRDPRFEIKHGSFAGLEQAALSRGWSGRVAGILMDLGVSSPQLDEPGRGFSFLKDGPLDMRMDTRSGSSAAEWLASVSEHELFRVLKVYGEERFARRIARAVVARRVLAPLVTTRQLAEVIERAVPVKERNRHPATRSFQAIRIAINGELDDLKLGLEQAVNVLTSGGRLVVIAFHSLEDRIVKRFMRSESRGEVFPPDMPVMGSACHPRLKRIGKAQRSGDAEIRRNPRARSAVLRVAERLP
ncbi:MAG: 16S rRNA (cytosine(1402)-N(4))-methyltransferase RsmH, partial [Pseudomonadota bacterium]